MHVKGLHPLGCRPGIRRRVGCVGERGGGVSLPSMPGMTGPATVPTILPTPESPWPTVLFWLLLFSCSSLPQSLCTTESLFLESLPFSNAALSIPPNSDFNIEDFYSPCGSQLNYPSYVEALTGFQLPPPPGLVFVYICMYTAVVQSLSHVRLFATPRTAARQASLSITNSQSLFKLMPMSRWCHPTVSSSVVPLLFPPSIFPSISVFSSESVLCIRWPKYWSFSFSISPSNEYSGLISFRIDWLDLLEVLGTLKSLLQHHS